MHHTKTGGFHQHYGRENTIRNNVFAFSKMYQVQATRVEDHRSFSFTNNIVIYDEGILFKGPWTKMDVELDRNLYWNVSGDVDFAGADLKAWQKNGLDEHSILADPGFKDAYSGDFKFSKLRSIKKINFKPFDYSKYGRSSLLVHDYEGSDRRLQSGCCGVPTLRGHSQFTTL